MSYFPFADIFVGQLKSELKFDECGHRSVTFDPFWDLSLPVSRVRQFNRCTALLKHQNGGTVNQQNHVLKLEQIYLLLGPSGPCNGSLKGLCMTRNVYSRNHMYFLCM